MKNLILFSILLLAFTSCKKSSNIATYKVRYVITGAAVNQFKITVNSADKTVSTPFTGTRDTTVYVASASNVKLDAKADGTIVLVGSIYVNDAMVTTISDPDTDKDNKTEVKLNYDLPSNQ